MAGEIKEGKSSSLAVRIARLNTEVKATSKVKPAVKQKFPDMPRHQAIRRR
jgi:hypothetical protein